MNARRRVPLLLSVSLAVAALLWTAVPAQAGVVKSSGSSGQAQKIKGRPTPADRAAAAGRLQLSIQSAGVSLAAASPTLVPGGNGYLVPDYFGTTPNFANSPLPPIVTFTSVDGNGSGAAAIATVQAGVVTSIKVTNGGSGYTAAPTVAITGLDGSGATATASIDASGVVTSVAVDTGGSGYGGIRKFVDSLPGLTAAGANNLGQYLPVAVPDTTTYSGSDYYVIELGQYTEKLHSDLPPTLLEGYRQVNTTDATVGKFSYLGPVIVAQKDRPVRIKFINNLPTGTGGNLFIPVDTTVMGAGLGPDGANSYAQNRATVHLHGGTTPWISDGTQHQWTTPAGENTPWPRGASVKFVPDMDGGNEPAGTLTFYYTNQQSARLMFYHDHAYGITRLNVYAGQAAGYLLTDPAEQTLVNGGTLPKADGTTLTVGAGTLPADEIPLVIQDKTFVPGPNQLAAEDPTWAWGPKDANGNFGVGNLWFPHVYMPNQNPSDLTGANAVGRWDYGPWFWPPYTGLAHGPIPNPYYDPVNAPWEPPDIPGTPNPSIVPEAFMDTAMVNGTVYPYVEVQPKAYRFRILNAANDRFWNLQLYKAASSGAMWDASGNMADPNAGDVKMVPFDSSYPGGFPAEWGTLDARPGGVPDPATAGPNMIQVGTEGGFLPAPVVIPNRPINYNYNRRDVTVLNVQEKALFLGPAERADVVVDFSQYAGQTLILYSDAPAPVPASDPRVDYYTGDPDQTATGGAPSTLPGYGPNTRTLLQIRVANTAAAPAYDLNALQNALPVAYAQYQDKPLVPQANYNTPFNANWPTDSYARIQSTSMSILNGTIALQLTNGGANYTSAPSVSITGGGGTGATATATLATAPVSAINPTDQGFGYTTVPAVSITGGGGSGAAGTAVLGNRGVVSVSVTSRGSGYTSPPTVTFSGGGGTGAAATATVSNGRVTAVTVTNPGSGYTSAPTVVFTGGGGTGAAATATLASRVVSVSVTNGGSNYSSAPTVTIAAPPAGALSKTATAQAVLAPRVVASLTLTNPGSGYTSAPNVSIFGGGGSGATAVASLAPVNVALQPKAVQELFDPEYGRMNALLGVEIPNTSATTQTTIPYTNFDPPTELFRALPVGDSAIPVATGPDGTQIWKITHNGVDTHAIHWHMFNVQVVNRVGWDGAVKPPDANELGWKDTVRMNPLEDIIVAMRPIIPNIPWDLPNSIRLMDVTRPAGSLLGFTNVDPTGQPAPVTNSLVNFGWEYVWHCHLLGHEENDMMRTIIYGVAPRAPAGLASPKSSTLSWSDSSLNETGFTVQRGTSANGPWTTLGTAPAATGAGTTVSFTNTNVKKGYWYRVIANNRVGYTQTYAAPAVGYPNFSADSAPSNVLAL